MTREEALQAATSSPLLSKFSGKQIGTLVATLKMLSYAASHPECQGSEPPLDAINDFMSVNPDLVSAYAQVAHLILKDTAEVLNFPAVPDHKAFADTIYPAIGGIISIAATGELHPSVDEIDEVINGRLGSSLIDRALTIVWTTFYPGQPLANGTVYKGVEEFAKVCRGELDA